MTVKNKHSTLQTTQTGRIHQIDLCGPLPPSFSYKYVVASLCAYSRMCILYPVKSTSAADMKEVLTLMFEEHGVPENIAIDFKCITLKGVDRDYLGKMGVGVIRSNNRSISQGIVERFFKDMIIDMTKILHHQDTLAGWPKVLGRVAFLHNIRPHSALGNHSPFEMAWRVAPRLVTSLIAPPEPGEGQNKRENFERMVELHEQVKQATYKNLVNNKHYYFPSEGLRVNQIVWRKRMTFDRHNSQKLQNKILEAFIVLRRVGTSFYKVRNVETGVEGLLPVDQMIRTRLSLDEVRGVIKQMR